MNVHDTDRIFELIRPGTTVFVPGSSGEPTAILEMLARHPERCSGVHFITTFVPGINQFDLNSLGPGARFTSFFMHPSLREAQADGRLELVNLSYSKLPGWFANQSIDVALMQISGEENSGRRSLGPAVEFTPLIHQQAKVSIGVSNQNTPWIDGSASIESAGLDLLIEGENQLPAYRDPEITQIYEKIAAHVAGLIPDSSSIQIGLGQAPAAALESLHGHRDLKLHSGIIFDSFLRLLDAGAISSEHMMVTGLAVGNSEFYDRLKHVSNLRIVDVGHTHDLEEMSRIPAYFTVNSAIEIDLQGNINAEYLAGKRISGPGGLPDYTAAGHASEGGASIIVLPSTNNKGTHSRIVRKAGHVTVPGRQIDYIITEHGCAPVSGVNPEERSSRLRAIAAPVFQKHLD